MVAVEEEPAGPIPPFHEAPPLPRSRFSFEVSLPVDPSCYINANRGTSFFPRLSGLFPGDVQGAIARFFYLLGALRP